MREIGKPVSRSTTNLRDRLVMPRSDEAVQTPPDAIVSIPLVPRIVLGGNPVVVHRLHRSSLLVPQRYQGIDA